MYASGQQYGEGHSPEPDASKAKRETRATWIQKRSGEKAILEQPLLILVTVKCYLGTLAG